MVGVRNGALAQAQLNSTGLITVAAVPANTTWLVKTLQLWNNSPAQLHATWWLSNPTKGISVPFTPLVVDANAGSFLQVWVALNPADRLLLSIDQAPVHVWVSGAELPGVIPA